MRKYLIALLVLLLFLIPFAVSAAAANGTLAVGQTVVTNVQPWGKEEYSFTPAESGEYAICMEETGANFQNWVCLDGGVELPERYYWVAGWEGKVFTLQAGKTYTIRVTHDTGFGGTFARKLRLEKVTATSSLSLHSNNDNNYPGEVTWVDPILSHPGAVSGNFQWSSSDPSVARIEDTANIHAAVMPVAPGKTTITLTVDGLTANYEFVVQDYSELLSNGGVDVTMEPGMRYMFTVTPTESGHYAVWNTKQGADITVTDAGIGQRFIGSGESRGWVYNLSAGVTYKCYVIVSPFEPGTIHDTIYAEKVQPLRSLSLTGDSNPRPEGAFIHLSAVTDPVYGVVEGVTWSCSNPDVLRLEHMDSTSAGCDAIVLKPGRATVTVTIGGLSASWEYGIPDVPLWELDTAVTMTMPKDQNERNAFIPEEDGYYRFAVTTDQDTFFTVEQGWEDPTLWGWQGKFVRAGEQTVVEVYLYKDIVCYVSNSGGLEIGTLSGRVERMTETDKAVSRVEVNSAPVYEFGNDDYGEVIDGNYHFRPLGYGGMEGLSFTVFYEDGTSASVSSGEMIWGEYTGMLTDCTWRSCPVEIILLYDGVAPTDMLSLQAPGTVTARLRYMGINADFPLTVTPGHAHQLKFVEKVDPTPEKDGMEAHYACSICGKLYWDENAVDRVRDPQQLVLSAGGSHVFDQDQVQGILQQMKPGETVNLPVPGGSLSVGIVPQILQSIVEAQNALELIMEEAILNLDSAALAAIAAQAGDDQVSVEIRQVEQNSLNESQKKALENHEVMRLISAEVLAGENMIHDFGGGQVLVQIPFEGERGKEYIVIYVADDGTVTQMPSQYRDGIMEFTTDHFSEYAIVTGDFGQTGNDLLTTENLLWAVPVIVAGVLTATAILAVWKKRSGRKIK